MGEARAAVDAIVAPRARVALHFDVDAVDSRDLALGNFPHYGTGARLAVAGQVLQTLLTVPGPASLTLTEVSPTHDQPSKLIERYLDTVVAALGNGLARQP